MRTFSCLCLISVLILFANINLSAQPANDTCFEATELVATPGTCIEGTTIDANPELPYANQVYCQGPVNAIVPAADVWYKVISEGTYLEIELNSVMEKVSLSLYEGECGTMFGRDCVVSEAGGNLSYTFAPVAEGQHYYLQISGADNQDQSDFELCLSSYTEATQVCIINQSLTINPSPVEGSVLVAAEPVDICITIGGYYQNAADWFDGIEPVFGDGWDLETLIPGAAPASCDGSYDGTWAWYESVTGTAQGALENIGPGYFYDLDGDGDPGNDFGDSGVNQGCPITFCFNITPKADCEGNSGNLSIEFLNFSDNEAGSWSSNNSPCLTDPNYEFKAVLACCLPPDVQVVSPICEGDYGHAIATTDSADVYNFVWTTNDGLWLGEEEGIYQSTLEELPPGNYRCSIENTAQCIAVRSFTVKDPFLEIAELTEATPNTCGLNNGSVSILDGYDVTSNFTLLDMEGNLVAESDTPLLENLPSGNYLLYINGPQTCLEAIEINIEELYAPGELSIVTQTNTSVAGAADASLEVEILGGTAPDAYSLNGGEQTESPIFENLAAGSYQLTWYWGQDCSQTVEVTITDQPSSTQDLQRSFQFKVYVNLMSGQTEISFQLPKPQEVEFSLCDLSGRLIQSMSPGYQAAGQQTFQLPLLDLPMGMYLVILETEAGKIAQKIIR